MRKRVYDIGVSVAIIVAAGLVYWDALKYRPGIYDPLGSGTMPRMVAVAIVVLCLVAIVQALLTRPRAAKPAKAEAGEDFERWPWLAFIIFIYVVICSILLYSRIPFGITSSCSCSRPSCRSSDMNRRSSCRGRSAPRVRNRADLPVGTVSASTSRDPGSLRLIHGRSDQCLDRGDAAEHDLLSRRRNRLGVILGAIPGVTGAMASRCCCR